jgi:hypothetical protein
MPNQERFSDLPVGQVFTTVAPNSGACYPFRKSAPHWATFADGDEWKTHIAADQIVWRIDG